MLQKIFLLEDLTPVMSWNNDYNTPIFKFIKKQIKFDFHINFPFDSPCTISINAVVASFKNEQSWLNTCVMDIFSSLMNEISCMNEKEPLPYHDESWFEKDLYFKSTGTLSGKSKKQFPSAPF